VTWGRADKKAIDSSLAALLRGDGGWPGDWSEEDSALAVRRAFYHGIAGLLATADLPPAAEPLRDEARARAMWELRHRTLLVPLLDAFGSAGISALLLKGTALAYTLYAEPAARSRGDTDLWIREEDLGPARAILQDQGFTRDSGGQADAMQFEEGWSLHAADGSSHSIDLHWSAINSAALRGLFDFQDCWERRLPITALGRHGWGLSPADALIHSAVHRALHMVSPYLVDDIAYHGGDRLIWAMDLSLLADALGPDGLDEAMARARAMGVEEALGDGLRFARDRLRANVPEPLLAPASSAHSVPARYLASGQVRRALLDLLAVPGWGERLATMRRRLFPDRAFLSGKYGGTTKGTAALALRRLAEFLVRRPGERRR
jgi:hypothetical protein